MSRTLPPRQQTDGYLAIPIRFISVALFGVDLHFEWGYTANNEVNALCEQMFARQKRPTDSTRRVRVLFYFNFQTLKGD